MYRKYWSNWYKSAVHFTLLLAQQISNPHSVHDAWNVIKQMNTFKLNYWTPSHPQNDTKFKNTAYRLGENLHSTSIDQLRLWST